MSKSPPAFDGVVLAGGSSTRMGTDKATIEIDGETLLRRAVAALQSGGAASIRVVGASDALVESHRELNFVPDRWPGEGPLGAVITALETADSDLVMVMSCDLTDASSIAVQTMVGAVGSADMALPVIEGRPQWLHTAWRKAAAGSLLTNFENGARSMHEGTRGLMVTRVLDGDPCWFNDVDTPDELANRRAAAESDSEVPLQSFEKRSGGTDGNT